MMDSLNCVSQALQEFHDYKSAIIHQGARDNWGIPKLELQSIVSGICEYGIPMQWSADVTEHAHINEIKVPARAGNNQNYHNQISCHLNRLDKCFQFDLAIEEGHSLVPTLDEAKDCKEAHEPDVENLSMSMYITPTRHDVDYFSISFPLLEGSNPNVLKPLRMFATSTTAFHLATKPSSQLSLTKTANKYNLPNLIPAVSAFVAQWNGTSVAPDAIKLQVWHNVHVQQKSYHTEMLEPPQTLRAHPPSASNPYGPYDSVIISPQADSDWLTRRHGLVGHSVIQLRLVFQPLCCDFFAAYVHHFNIGNVSAVTRMHLLK